MQQGCRSCCLIVIRYRGKYGIIKVWNVPVIISKHGHACKEEHNCMSASHFLIFYKSGSTNKVTSWYISLELW